MIRSAPQRDHAAGRPRRRGRSGDVARGDARVHARSTKQLIDGPTTRRAARRSGVTKPAQSRPHPARHGHTFSRVRRGVAFVLGTRARPPDGGARSCNRRVRRGSPRRAGAVPAPDPGFPAARSALRYGAPGAAHRLGPPGITLERSRDGSRRVRPHPGADRPRARRDPRSARDARRGASRPAAAASASRRSASGSTSSGIKYIFFQQVSVSGHVNGKGVVCHAVGAGRRGRLPARLRRDRRPLRRPRRPLHRLRPGGVGARRDRRPRHVRAAPVGLRASRASSATATTRRPASSSRPTRART